MNKEEKLKIAREVKAKINKDLGKGTVMSLSENGDMDIEVISTGSLGLDIALGRGGLPRGRIVEIYGPESSGKTTLAIHTIAEAQKMGGLCAVVDAEHAFDKDYARSLGVNVDELDFSQPENGDQGLEIAERMVASGAYDVVLVDSVAALTPKAEIEGEMGENKMGLHARLMSQACRKMVASTSKTGTLLIFINQLREKIGVMFGSPEVTTGGNALKFYASVRLDVRRSITEKNSVIVDDIKVGNQTTVKVIKNKIAPPFGKCEFDIIYGKGIDKLGEIVDKAVELEIINKQGSWFTYGADVKIQGRDAVKVFLADNIAFAEEIEGIIRGKLIK